MITLVNGHEEPWVEWIQKLWTGVDRTRTLPGVVTRANFYMPRPAVDEYNRGSEHFGFTYTVDGRHVFQVQWHHSTVEFGFGGGVDKSPENL